MWLKIILKSILFSTAHNVLNINILFKECKLYFLSLSLVKSEITHRSNVKRTYLASEKNYDIQNILKNIFRLDFMQSIDN